MVWVKMITLVRSFMGLGFPSRHDQLTEVDRNQKVSATSLHVENTSSITGTLESHSR